MQNNAITLLLGRLSKLGVLPARFAWLEHDVAVYCLSWLGAGGVAGEPRGCPGGGVTSTESNLRAGRGVITFMIGPPTGIFTGLVCAIDRRVNCCV